MNLQPRQLAASAYNVRVNHRYLRDAELVARQAGELNRLETAANDLLAKLRAALT